MGSHILTFSIMLNVITSHSHCTIVFTICGFIVSLVFTLPRTLKSVSYFAVASFISVISAVIITIVGVAVDDRQGKLAAALPSSLEKGFLAVADIIFAYGW